MKYPVFANKVVKATVAALKMFAAKVPTVAFNRVVDARVDDPETSRFAAVSVPEFVEEEVMSAVSTPVCAIRLVRVVEASVDDPVILRLSAVSFPLFVDEEIFNPVKLAS